MFEKTVLRRSALGTPISAGELAEALLYYQNVHLIIDHGTFKTLVKQIGMPALLALLKRPNVSAVYCEESVGTHTESIGAFQVHAYLAFTFTGHVKVGGHLEKRQQRFEYLLQEEGYNKKQAAKSAELFLERVPVRRLTGDHYIKGGVTHAAKSDLLDKEFAHAAVRHALAETPGCESIDGKFKFDVIDTDIGFHVFTDLALEQINRTRALLTPALEPLTVAMLLTHILDARTDLALASFYGGDFVTSATTSAIVRLRHSELLRRTGLHAVAATQFTEVLMPDTPALRDVIDSGERTFDEFLLLLDKADRFKRWLQAVNPDEGLVRTYIRDVSSEAWVQKLPAKSIRYMITNAIDHANPIAGFVAGVVDNFLLEKLLGGWRPNHFVDSRLRPFIAKE
jgi:hypothetical protein